MHKLTSVFPLPAGTATPALLSGSRTATLSPRALRKGSTSLPLSLCAYTSQGAHSPITAANMMGADSAPALPEGKPAARPTPTLVTLPNLILGHIFMMLPLEQDRRNLAATCQHLGGVARTFRVFENYPHVVSDPSSALLAFRDNAREVDFTDSDALYVFAEAHRKVRAGEAPPGMASRYWTVPTARVWAVNDPFALRHMSHLVGRQQCR